MKKYLFAVIFLPFLAGAALAAQALSDTQMDRIVAGDTAVIPPTIMLPPTECPGCTSNNAPGTSSSGGPPNSSGQPSQSTGGASACPGCTGGQTFAVAIGQPLYPALVQFLVQVGYSQPNP
jgi:hypothetical protein